MFLASIFSDHAILQHGVPIPVWGWADTGRRVTATLGGQSRSLTVPEGGYWEVWFDPIEPGGSLTLTAGDGYEIITRRDLYAGEVWICSGQSNMQWRLEQLDDAEGEIAGATDRQLRLFHPTPWYAAEPQIALDAEWKPCDPEAARTFSGVAYLFGRILRNELNVPIGLINVSLGGSKVQSWMSRSLLESDLALRSDLDRYDFDRAHYLQNKKAWEGASSSDPPPIDPANGKAHVNGLFNALIAPLIPFAHRGVIWYQGEANAYRAYHYRRQFSAMIRGWRARWKVDDHPFLFVQLPNYILPGGGEEWAEMRESQAKTLELPATGMAVTIDVGDPHDIHPADKHPVAARLAKLALRQVYGRDVAAYGPTFDSFAIEGDELRVRFRHTEGGLETRSGGPVAGFVLAGDDLQFHEAEATIEGASVVVGSPEVSRPVAARYAWADNPTCNLYNSAGLPAAPFRTDTCPGVTDLRR